MAQPERNYLQPWLTWLILLPVFVVAAVLGFVVFLTVLGVVLLGVMTIMLRLWWVRRKMRRPAGDGYLETEYVVVQETKQKKKPRVRQAKSE